MNTENLTKLADYLESLPSDYKHFDMASYLGDDEHPDYFFGGRPCKTVACAVGHGPAAGIPPLPEEICEDGLPDWEAYGARLLPAWRSNWWVACSSWALVDNHHYGAAARIRYLLFHGRPPAGFLSTFPPSNLPLLYQEFRKHG